MEQQSNYITKMAEAIVDEQLGKTKFSYNAIEYNASKDFRLDYVELTKINIARSLQGLDPWEASFFSFPFKLKQTIVKEGAKQILNYTFKFGKVGLGGLLSPGTLGGKHHEAADKYFRQQQKNLNKIYNNSIIPWMRTQTFN